MIKTKQDLIDSIKLNYERLTSYRVINLRKLYRVWEQQHLRRLLPFFNVDCVFDVGANYGQYAKMLRKNAGYKGLIISFEPIPDAAKHLKKISENDSLWIIEECALSVANGHQEFNIMSGSEFSSLSEPRHDEVNLFKSRNKVAEKLKVKTETLDSAFQRLKQKYQFMNPFLKMDTQGFDVEIITHGSHVIRNFIGLQSELAIKKLYRNSIDFREALSCYEDCGFSLSAFVPNNAGHFPQLIEIDCIMIRNDLVDQIVVG